MQQLPDAPWIREAEREGTPVSEDVCCPICDYENPEKFYAVRMSGIVIGCTQCLKTVDPYEWLEEQREEGPD